MEKATEQIIKLEELEKRLNSLNKRISSQAENLLTLNTEFGNIETEIENISTTIEDLGKEIENLPTGSEPAETPSSIFSCFDKMVCPTYYEGSNTVRTDRIFFVCKPGVWTKIKVKADIFMKSSKELTGYSVITLNEKGTVNNRIFYETYIYNGEFSKTIEFEYEFIPTKEDNMIQVFVHPGEYEVALGSAGFTNMEIEIYGQNVMILTRKNDFKVFITKDNYYITKNFETGSSYKICPTNNVDLSQGFMVVGELKSSSDSYKSRKSYFNVTAVPQISYNSSLQKYEFSSTPYFYFMFTYNGTIYYGKQNPGASTLASVISYGPTYNAAHPISTGSLPYNVGSCYTYQGCYCYTGVGIEGTQKKSARLKYLGANLEGDWLDNYSVFAKDWEDNIGLRPNCYVATSSLGEIYFFPTVDSDYKILIGKGCQVNAYMQSDLSINVYYRRFGDVFKKVLKLNPETNKYELQDGQEIFSNAYEVIEGYGNDYFINKLGTWEYVKN